jgi:hypothetical protein
MLEAQEKQTKYAAGKEINVEVRDRAWLLIRLFRTDMPLKKLDYKHAGPYPVSKTINQNSYKLDLPKTICNHNMFHVSLLGLYTPPTISQLSSERHPVIVDNSQEWEVEQILNSK